MKIHRFYYPADLTPENTEITDSEIVNQAYRVLKLRAGEKISLFDGVGGEYMAKIISADSKKIQIKIERRENKANQIKNKVTLYCAILKKENFELVVQKATEVGVSKIVPLITARTIKTNLNIDRLRKISIEAAEQSGRVTIPEISEPIKFEEAIKNTNTENYFFHANSASLSEKYGYFPAEKFLVFGPSPSQAISESMPSFGLFIGPEGGWTDEEVKIVKENNFKMVSLGSLTLRAETAAIISSYLAINK